MKFKVVLLFLFISTTSVFSQNTTTTNEQNNVDSDTIDINTNEILQIGGIGITPMKITGRGKFVNTKSARSTHVMRIDFQIKNNKFISPGYKEVYILIQNPKGVILNRKGTFDVYGGKKLRFTDKTEAYYENNQLRISILTEKFIQKMVKGVYTVTIYIENYPVGLELIRLR
jgi:hypothetical protein